VSAEPPPVAILAGGLGTRLRPITETIPKALVDVHGEPFITHQLRLLAASGLRRVVLCTGRLGEMIEAEIGDGTAHGVRVDYSRDGATPLGTAGALKRALPLLGDGFFVLYGDSYLEMDYLAALAAFDASGKPALMTVYRNEGRGDRSNVEYDGTRVLSYDKKHPTGRMRHIDHGLGLLRPEVLDDVPAGAPCDLADVYAALVGRGALAAFEVHQRFFEIGSPAGLEETRRYLFRRDPN
jgi:NDP-sugar pyrophosphorylase family protein